jgi:macrodomain Ter protein organizer (MatP/YcbG family)
MNLVGWKWVFKIKQWANGYVERYNKASLMAKGYHQQASLDHGETYNPVVKPITIQPINYFFRLVIRAKVSNGLAL